jgi:hypothetical protein
MSTPRPILAQRQAIRPVSLPTELAELASVGGAGGPLPALAADSSEGQAVLEWSPAGGSGSGGTGALVGTSLQAVGRTSQPSGDLRPSMLQRATVQPTGEPRTWGSEGTVIMFPTPPASTGDRGQPAGPIAQLLALQRQDTVSSGGDDGASAPSAPPPAAAPPPSAAPGAAAAPGTGDAELDELGRRLYPRIRDHLKAELSMDRERAGLLNDLGLR